ncbi:unnamed protein product [Owenia fusiformis]|uniref:Ribosomal protein L2 n=1 Tax=Owenia fusiformis TaxID=6347 RepID=A0A8J1T6C0_OWEFU|nr:unnamed protein product [Owenia fusiformis]
MATPAKLCNILRGITRLSLDYSITLSSLNSFAGSQIHTSAACSASKFKRAMRPNVDTSLGMGRTRYDKVVESMDKYTVRPLKMHNGAGRGPDGRIWTHGIGGGAKRNFRMVDFVRKGINETEPLVEKVDTIIYDPNRSAILALVASGTHKRYIIATENMKKGDIIKSSSHIPRMAVKPREGDSHPLGALPINTIVCCIELFPGQGGILARAGNSSGQLIRKVDGRCIIKIPSKREINVSEHCVATVGRTMLKEGRDVIGKAGRNRWLGIRPQSGLWHRKTGRFGRKLRAPPAMVTYNKPKPPPPTIYQFSS